MSVLDDKLSEERQKIRAERQRLDEERRKQNQDAHEKARLYAMSIIPDYIWEESGASFKGDTSHWTFSLLRHNVKALEICNTLMSSEVYIKCGNIEGRHYKARPEVVERAALEAIANWEVMFYPELDDPAKTGLGRRIREL